jgi:hypothetical protein
MRAHASQRLVGAPRRITISRLVQRVQVVRVAERFGGGAEGTRTPDIRLAKAALSQLSYGPGCADAGGPAWNRTRDLSLIRTAL